MIYTVSVIKGQSASLGFLFLNMGFFFGNFAVVDIIPSNEQLAPYDRDEQNLTIMFGFQQVLHFMAILLAISSFNLSVFRHMDVILEIGSTIVVLAFISVYMYWWDLLIGLLNGPEPLGERPIELQKFTIWIMIEAIFLLAIAISNFLFLLFRSCTRNMIDVRTNDYVDNDPMLAKAYEKA